MTTLAHAAALVTATLLAGCSGGAGNEPDRAAEAPTGVELVSRPHFTGGMDVVLRTGRIAYNDDPCQSMDEDRVCDASGDREYLVLGQSGSARLVEARMDPAAGNTAWTVTVTFSPESAGTFRGFRELARDTGAVVLVVDDAGEVLLTATVPRIEGRRVTFPGLEKPDAWNLVEQIAER